MTHHLFNVFFHIPDKFSVARLDARVLLPLWEHAHVLTILDSCSNELSHTKFS
jgi:hypothetical protein